MCIREEVPLAKRLLRLGFAGLPGQGNEAFRSLGEVFGLRRALAPHGHAPPAGQWPGVTRRQFAAFMSFRSCMDA